MKLAIDDRLVILNSAADPFVQESALRLAAGELVLAEDNLAALQRAQEIILRERAPIAPRHIPFHEYTLHMPPATMDIAVMNILYQPSKAWIDYALQLAAYTLKPGGQFLVQGAKDRGILTLAKRMGEMFGGVETLEIHKGERVVRSICNLEPGGSDALPVLTPFAEGKLDEGTRLLLEALDIGCGAGYIGCHVASRAVKGKVTMVDASLAAVDAARRMIEQRGLPNARALASDGTQAVREERYDLVVTNPPFHIGGIQTTEIGHRFIREAALVLHPRGRFYLVANRFLKYETTMRECFSTVEEVGGNTRFKVLRGMGRPDAVIMNADNRP
ncbi:MAG TPA: class I SAM-dependent methyltransferase [Chthonomonadales bacterium]|nr:class I SAM-dependent methyltransferase [Chthonomonadales bacterium]